MSKQRKQSDSSTVGDAALQRFVDKGMAAQKAVDEATKPKGKGKPKAAAAAPMREEAGKGADSVGDGKPTVVDGKSATPRKDETWEQAQLRRMDEQACKCDTLALVVAVKTGELKAAKEKYEEACAVLRSMAHRNPKDEPLLKDVSPMKPKPGKAAKKGKDEQPSLLPPDKDVGLAAAQGDPKALAENAATPRPPARPAKFGEGRGTPRKRGDESGGGGKAR